MELILHREYKKPTYTIGKIYVNNRYLCDTLEDTVRDLSIEKKVKGSTAIPEGRYRVVLTWSPRFRKVLPLLLNVPQFDGIRIHSGNDEEDTDGCILVGRNTLPGQLTSSRIVFNELMQQLTTVNNRQEPIWINIE